MYLTRFAVVFSVFGCFLWLLTSISAHAAAPSYTALQMMPTDSTFAFADPRVSVNHGSPVITYTSRSQFVAANPNLPVDDFEAGLAAPNSVAGCLPPISSTTDNQCFPAGGLRPGVEYSDRPLSRGYTTDALHGVLSVGTGYGGTTSKVLMSNTLTDQFQMVFSEPTYAVGFDLISIGTITVTITVFDRLENLIATVERPANSAGSNFFGIRTPAAIGRMVLTSNATEGVDDLAFGDPGNVGAVSVALTVGTDGNECASTTSTAVVPGMTVYYCYRVTNHSAYPLNYHRVPDDHFGEVLDNVFYGLAPGDTVTTVDLGLTLAREILTDTVQTGTWNAGEVSGYDVTGRGSCSVPDISGTGIALNLSDDGTAPVTLPFTFPFFDRSSNQLRIGNNGLVQFDSTATSFPFINRPLPTTGLDYAIAPLWDDWDSETGDVYYQYLTNRAGMGTDDETGSNTFVVQWDELSHVPGPNTDTYTFQLELYPDSQLMVFCYPDLFGDDNNSIYGGSATIGLNRDVNYGSYYSYNERFMGNGEGFAFGRDLGGVYFRDSATATVTVGYPDVNVVPGAITQTHTTAPQTTTAIIAIENLGNGPLDWNLTDTAASCLAPSDLSWLSAEPAGGITNPTSATNVTLTFNSTGLADGVHEGSLCVSSNDGTDGLVAIPITLNVTNGETTLRLYLPVIERE